MRAAVVLVSAATHGEPSGPALGETIAGASRQDRPLPRLVRILLVEVASLLLGTALDMGMGLGTGLGLGMRLRKDLGTGLELGAGLTLGTGLDLGTGLSLGNDLG